jgi:hypothetical protein
MPVRRDKEAFPSGRGSRPNRTSILNTTVSELIFNGRNVPKVASNCSTTNDYIGAVSVKAAKCP